jgi:serine/threonine protein kinase
MNDQQSASTAPGEALVSGPGVVIKPLTPGTQASTCSGHDTMLRKTETRQEKSSLSNLQIYFDKNLGRGSFSKVFPGKYKGILVAVKIIYTKYLDSKIARQLQRELQVIRILQEHPHPNIATYYKIFNTPDKMIIVMELCSGGELSKYIKIKMDLETIRSYFCQILDGYKHLLELNIVHRDIKSANILLTQDKRTIKFIDFGLSKIFSTDLNQTICGSPLYMAPELLNHQDYDSKSDIWSLGVLLYEMVYGFTPFHQCKVIKTLKQTVQTDNINYPKKSADKSYDVPPDMIAYMKRLLELNPLQRIDWEDLNDANWLKPQSNELSIDPMHGTQINVNKNLPWLVTDDSMMVNSGTGDSVPVSVPVPVPVPVSVSVSVSVNPVPGNQSLIASKASSQSSNPDHSNKSKRSCLGSESPVPLATGTLVRVPQIQNFESGIRVPQIQNFGFGLALSQESGIRVPQIQNFGFGLALSQESEIRVPRYPCPRDKARPNLLEQTKCQPVIKPTNQIPYDHEIKNDTDALIHGLGLIDPFFTESDLLDSYSEPDKKTAKLIMPPVPVSRARYSKPTQVSHSTHSKPIPIKSMARPRSHSIDDGWDDLIDDQRNGLPLTPGAIDQGPDQKYFQGESFGTVCMNEIQITDISVIKNLDKEYDNLINQQKLLVTESGLISVDDVPDILIANVPDKTTAYEYISNGSKVWGSYMYSKSAPIASSIINGIGHAAKKTVDTLGNILMSNK